MDRKPLWMTATEPMMRKMLKYGLISGALLALAACNTVAGAGKDVSSAGDAVTNAAKPTH